MKPGTTPGSDAVQLAVAGAGQGPGCCQGQLWTGLDAAWITYSRRTVDFKNTVIIMTSNIGAPHLLEGIDREGHIEEGAKAAVMGELRRHFRPEFLSRVDEIVLFKPLQLSEIARIVDLLADQLRLRLGERQMKLWIADGARDFIAKEGYDPVYGARSLKRFLQREVETKLGRAILSGNIKDGSVLKVELEAGQLVIRHEDPAPKDDEVAVEG